MSRFVLFGKKEVKLYLPNDLEMQNRLVEWLQYLPASVVSLVDTGIFDGLSAEYSARDGITALSYWREMFEYEFSQSTYDRSWRWYVNGVSLRNENAQRLISSFKKAYAAAMKEYE